jgi:hypothetical protein
MANDELNAKVETLRKEKLEKDEKKKLLAEQKSLEEELHPSKAKKALGIFGKALKAVGKEIKEVI